MSASFPFCQWCGVPTLVHPPAVEQRVDLGPEDGSVPLTSCAYAPVAEIVAAHAGRAALYLAS